MYDFAIVFLFLFFFNLPFHTKVQSFEPKCYISYTSGMKYICVVNCSVLY